MKASSLVLAATFSCFLTACGGSSTKKPTPTPAPTPAPAPAPAPTPSPTPTPAPAPTPTPSPGSSDLAALSITAVPASLSGTYTAALKFNRYTKVDAPNGKPIHIIAQDGIKVNQIVRSRSILQHYLVPYAGSLYGTKAQKDAVANKMADNNATLMLLNGKDDGTNGAANLNGQPLYHDEMQVEGGAWYISQNYEHRDASFEEILHMVHDYGIGVDQGTSFIGALPTFQAEIRAAQVNALSNKLWGIGAASWITELTNENSLSQEYLAAVIDVYYGLWGAWTRGTGGMSGLYVAKTRADIKTKDPLGEGIVTNKFFQPYLTYNARIDESFTGSFSLKFNTTLSYTNVSQYLKDITLTGTNDSGAVVNQLDNNITGNSGNNTITFSGQSSQYTVTKNGETVTVKDMMDNRDGTNTLTNVESLKFTDTTTQVSSL